MAYLVGLDPSDMAFPAGLDPPDMAFPAGLDPSDTAFVSGDTDLLAWDRAIAASERVSVAVADPVADSVAVAAPVFASRVSAGVSVVDHRAKAVQESVAELVVGMASFSHYRETVTHFQSLERIQYWPCCRS